MLIHRQSEQAWCISKANVFIKPLEAALVAADLVVETDGSQVTVPGVVGAEMGVWVAVILAVEVAIISPPTFLSAKRKKKEKKKQGFPFRKKNKQTEWELTGRKCNSRNHMDPTKLR